MKTETIKKITTALFLGAIGSGIWSIAGEPALNWCVDIFISIAQSANSGYYDLLHANIGKSFHEENAVFLAGMYRVILIMAIIALPYLAHKTYKRVKDRQDNVENKKEKEQLDSIEQLVRKRKIFFIVTILYSITAAPFYLSRVIVDLYNHEAIVFTEQSIEILSPKLHSKSIIQLRADYRSVSDAEGFYKLYDKLISIAKKNNITLPEFDIAR